MFECYAHPDNQVYVCTIARTEVKYFDQHGLSLKMTFCWQSIYYIYFQIFDVSHTIQCLVTQHWPDIAQRELKGCGDCKDF